MWMAVLAAASVDMQYPRDRNWALRPTQAASRERGGSAKFEFQRAMHASSCGAQARQPAATRADSMSRDTAIARANTNFDSGEFFVDLGRRDDITSTGQVQESDTGVRSYLEAAMLPVPSSLGIYT